MGCQNPVNGFTVDMCLGGGGADSRYAVGERIHERQRTYLPLQLIIWIAMSNMRSVFKCWLCFVFSVYISKLVLASLICFFLKLVCPVSNTVTGKLGNLNAHIG